MDTKKVGNVTIDTSKLKRLEELVDLAADDYDTSDNDPLIKEIREITGSTLDDDTICYEYCSHYWSAYSLSEVVYALMNNGEYPDDLQEYKVIFWKTCSETNLTNEYIYKEFMFRKDETIEYAHVLEDFPLSEIFEWIKKQFPHFKLKYISPDKKDRHFVLYSFRPDSEERYGIGEKITVTIFCDQMVEVQFKHIDENIRNDLAEYMKSLGSTVYYNK